ncbi:Heme exporter protein CcmA [Candidatus Promineifilum breve]|uniref:Heme exporter protein CcmA n=1 Tax=Candidatus Promineifilum breve TaxID=1806508 RepID=A0A161K320_9CHLR|nr:heme ABC exporter ATP-binding protein CcmA [Candidatus Promineifilum breve]CUS03447.2 Heme exporter protein CcmA [Candidatus Promineifilum breve]
MIRLSGIVKHYGLNPVLRGVDLTVGQGEFVTLVGPNGAGKSTLLGIVATLLRPTSGEARVGGWRLPEQADRVRRHIGLVSHQPLLYRDLTAAENLTFFAKLYRLPEAEARVAEALRKVGLFARQRDPVGAFSRGMVQRLTIARATLHEPDVLLLDEPYTGLDQEATHLLDDLLREETARGRTILMITHDLGHGLGLADRLAILHGGRIAHEVSRAAISPAAVYDLYAEVTMM